MVLMLPLLTVASVLLSCRRAAVTEPDTVYAGAGFTIYRDSIVQGRDIYRPEQSSDTSVFATGLPVTDALLRMALGEVTSRLHPDSLPGLSISDLSYAADMTLIYLDPETVRDALRARLRHGRIIQDDGPGGSWPVTTDRVTWITAAYQLYKLTGDRKWLKEAYQAAERALTEDMVIGYDGVYKMMHGVPAVRRNGDVRHYPAWMEPVDLFETMGLATNVAYVGAFEAAAAMAAELGYERPDFTAAAETIRASVNERLWIPNLGYYSCYLYGGINPLQAQMCDNLAQAQAVVTGVADRAHSQMLLNRTPRIATGTPSVFPFMRTAHDDRVPAPDLLVQAAWNRAAARTGDVGALRDGLGALFRAAAFGDVTSALPEIVTQAALLSTLYSVFLGITLEADSMSFMPVIPPEYAGTKYLNGLRYRDAVVDVTVRGTGTAIASFSIDGLTTGSHKIPASLTGNHRIEIVMANNRPASTSAPVTEVARMPQVPEVEWTGRRQARILNHTPGINYLVYLNDAFLVDQIAPSFTLADQGGTVTVAFVPVSDNRNVGFSQRPYMYVPPGYMTILDATESSVKGTTKLITTRRLARRFVEVGRRKHRRVKFKFSVPHEGDYLVDLRYANGSGPVWGGDMCALRTLTVNGEAAGVLVMPQRGTGYWLATGYSNMLRVRLRRGENTISIDYREAHNANMNKETNTALIQYIRIIRD